LCRQLNTMRPSLNATRSGTLSQCSSVLCKSREKPRSNLCLPLTTRAAAFSTHNGFDGPWTRVYRALVLSLVSVKPNVINGGSRMIQSSAAGGGGEKKNGHNLFRGQACSKNARARCGSWNRPNFPDAVSWNHYRYC